MGSFIAHRGPDAAGDYVGEGIGLAHRRLKIIDLSEAAAQPMHSRDGRYTLAFNGMIYNFRELRKELESAGVVFSSRSDTEVVLHAIAMWGDAAVGRFNGMFAFALWDAHKRELLLARDRYGIKPLYWTKHNDGFLFASEIKAFLGFPGFSVGLDQEALVEYFTFQNFFTEKTLFEGVNTFPAGCVARVSVAEADSLKFTRYWDFDFHQSVDRQDEDDVAEELKMRLSQAVRRQLVSDVPVGCYLSGGIDSGSVTAVAAGEINDLMSFTIGFDLSSASGLELAFDEREQSEFLSGALGTEHYEMVLKAGDMERCMKKLVWHLEEPRVGQSYPNYYAAKLASGFVTVVLTGTGGDELFGGYPWRYYRKPAAADFDTYVDEYYSYWQRLLPAADAASVFRKLEPNARSVDTKAIFDGVFLNRSARLNSVEDYINYSLYFEAKTFLHGLLTVEDKLSMAWGVESRVPLLDNDLVDLAMTTPARMKIANLPRIVQLDENEPGSKPSMYFDRTNDGKNIMRRAVSDMLPPAITDRPKQGFSAPDASWFRGKSVEYVRSLLSRSDARIYDFLDREALNPLIEQHFTGTQNRRLLIWSLLMFEHWCDIFLDGGYKNLN